VAKVTLTDVWKIFDKDVVAAKEIDLEIQDREFMVLVGPSGCGKSTTLRMIAGLEEITRGEIMIGDRIVNDVLPKDRDIAMVFQNYALYPHMTVYKNMAFGLQLRKFKKDLIDRPFPTRFGLISQDTRDRQVGALGVESRRNIDRGVRTGFLPLAYKEVMEPVGSHQVRDGTERRHLADEFSSRCDR
jgi:multiple sugar transport system ATP-binding protein